MKTRSSGSGIAPRETKSSRKRLRAKLYPRIDHEVALRQLRGAYLPLHEEEQSRIPLMASLVDVEAASEYYARREHECLGQLHIANTDLRAKMAQFSSAKRGWNKGRQNVMDEPESDSADARAIFGFDRPSRPAKSKRETYRANTKLRSPRKTRFDTVRHNAMCIRTPIGKEKSRPVLPDIVSEEDSPEREVQESPLAHMALIPQAQMREKLFMMEKEISSMLKDAKTLDLGEWEHPPEAKTEEKKEAETGRASRPA